MKTRHASADSHFRQERYMSAPELQRSLAARCVASKCRAVSDGEHRKLIWFLQSMSQTDDGLERAADEMLRLWPGRIATAAMHELGTGAGRIYSAEEVRRVREEFLEWNGDTGFPLFGELTSGEREQAEKAAQRYERFTLPEDPCEWGSVTTDESALSIEERRLSQQHPKSYPATAFLNRCMQRAHAEFASFLFRRLCLDPSVQIDTRAVSYLPDLSGMLRDYHVYCARRADEAAGVQTAIGAIVAESLDYALGGRGSSEPGIVVIDGRSRVGKTFAAKSWCAAHPGEARYVQVPSSNDDISFFRAIAASLGIGTGYGYKAVELRERVEDVLHGGDLMLVLDEGHYLWPQRNMRKATPHRINWIMTQLVNMGVPVAIVTTPQFSRSQEALVKHGGWSSEQLIGRIELYQELPGSLSKADLAAVARSLLPEGDDDSIAQLVAYAQASDKYLAGISAGVRRARYIAERDGCEEVTFLHVDKALHETVVPSDNAMLARFKTTDRKPARSARAMPLQAPCTPPADDRHKPFSGARETAPALHQRRDTGLAATVPT